MSHIHQHNVVRTATIILITLVSEKQLNDNDEKTTSFTMLFCISAFILSLITLPNIEIL